MNMLQPLCQLVFAASWMH